MAKRKPTAKAKSKSKPAAKPRRKAKPAARASAKRVARATLAPMAAAAPAAIAPAAAAAAATLDLITTIAGQSPIARRNWPGRGVAPRGYIKGMALTFARVLCKLKGGDAAAVEMAKAKTGDDSRDALSWYNQKFLAAGMRNDVAGPDTLRHLFVLMVGLGMRESSGRYCEGRDRSAHNVTAETAEAGLFQTSFDARTASPLMPTVFVEYQHKPAGFVDVFKEGVTCRASDLQNFGSGPGAEFQRLSKESPAFAAEFAAVGLRNIRKHWGPINTRAAEVVPDCDTMLAQVQAIVDASPGLCALLV
jgi:hypothetical protein